jgi:hypothetical protein
VTPETLATCAAWLAFWPALYGVAMLPKYARRLARHTRSEPLARRASYAPHPAPILAHTVPQHAPRHARRRTLSAPR